MRTGQAHPIPSSSLGALFAAGRVLLPWVAGAGLLGFLLGALLGLRDWSPVWPTLSALKVLRTGALGWLAGGLLAVLFARVFVRRTREGRRATRRRRVLRGVLLALGLLPLGLWLAGAVPLAAAREVSALSRRPADTRPNLILITVDALRADHLGAYGDRRGLTPNLDALAKEATVYTSAYAASTWTLTSLGALATGLPPSESGLTTTNPYDPSHAPYSAGLPEKKALLAERLRRAGYATAADVTNVFLEPERGWRRGFESFRNEGGVDGDRAEFAHADTLTEHSAAWLRLNWRRPFFLWLHYLDPHCPYDSPDTPKALRAEYPRTWVARRDRWRNSIRRQSAQRQALYQRFCRDMYAEEVRYVDRWIGKLLAELKAAGLYDTSLIVVTADHGEELFDHGGIDHGHSMHAEVLSVPLLVKWPRGVTADARVTQVVAVVGVAGTLLEAAHARGLNGLPEALPTRDGGAGSEVYSEGVLYGTVQTALTTDDYRVIYHPYASSPGERFEVYDRRKDRPERHDLAKTGAAAGLRRRLKEMTEVAEAQESRGPGTRIRLSEETKRRMRSLGYLGR